MTVTIHTGDCRNVLRTLPAQSVHTCISSPPYFGLRDYGVAGQIGLEARPDCLGWAAGSRCGECFVCTLVDVYREVRRVLRDDGTCWVNLGDSYAGSGKTGGKAPVAGTMSFRGAATSEQPRSIAGLKPKDLMGMPWRVALALQADGWYLRQDIIWAKPNPMPESIKDRCTKAHEYLFLLAKSERYYFDAAAIREPANWNPDASKMPDGWDTGAGGHGAFHRNGREKGARSKRYSFARETKSTPGSHGQKAQHRADREEIDYVGSRNKRSVWTVATQPYAEAHFATYPSALIEPCVLASCPVGGTVLDPFGGSGTTSEVAENLGRHSILIELSPEYAALAARRTRQTGLSLHPRSDGEATP